MIDVSRLKPCCYDCLYPDLKMDQVKCHYEDKWQAVAIIGCSHSKVCRAYLEKQEASDDGKKV